MVTPAPLAGVTDLADWIGEAIATDAEKKRAALCLRTASALVRTESGQTWLEEDKVTLVDSVPEAAFTVTLYCAARVYDNWVAQTRGGVDDYSEDRKVDESGAYLTTSEKRMLAPLRPASRGIGTIATTRGGFAPPATGWVPTPTPDVYFPWY